MGYARLAVGVLTMLAMAALAMAAPAVAQKAGPDAAKLPATTACPGVIAGMATCYAARLDTGAYLTAAMPKDWNGDLVVFAHGGPSLLPPSPDGSKADLDKYAFAVRRGFAWVASSYRREGYGVAMAAADTDDARTFFVDRIATPRHTILHGASYGGLVGAKLIETRAKTPDGRVVYDGALLNSGAVSGATLNYQHRADLRAVYQYYCRNLPRPDEPPYPLWNGVAAGARMTLRDLDAVVDACTGVGHPAAARTPAQQRNLADILAVMTYPEGLLVRHMQAATLLFRDIVQHTTGGRNPFSNIGIRYTGSTDDAALNRDVARFEADPAAAAALQADGDLTGAVPVPVVSIHSLNDPQVAVEAQSVYREVATAAGNGERLVQAYTDERGHTAQSAPELAAALDALMRWIEHGSRPTPPSIAAGCEALRGTLEGPCRWRVEFTPKPYGTKFYSREAAVR